MNRTSETWKITPELEKEFEELKAFLDKKVHLSPIRTGNNLLLYTDASINGLGYVLCQERKVILDEEEETIRDIIHLGSTSVTEVQACYSPVELECLAAQWACEKCHYFLADAPKINLFTDSSGLVGLRKKDLSETKNRRIQRILEKMVCYNIEAFYIPAKENGIAD